MNQETTTWRIAGGSGDGIDSTSRNFATVLKREGYHIFTHRHYPSRIRGGHTFAEIRIGNKPVLSRGDGYDVLLALGDSFARSESDGAYYGNEEIKPLTENLHDLNEGGVIVYDSSQISSDELPDNLEERADENNWSVIPVGLKDLARENGRAIMRNTAGVGFTAAMLGVDRTSIEDILAESMGDEILEQNKDVLEEAYNRVEKMEDVDIDLPDVVEHDEDQVLLSGDDAVTYGAVDEGVQFIAGYPMTPWTGVFSRLSQIIPKNGGVAEQVEDEIAACAMAVGASHAGAKAMSGSSGGGFALMSEPLGMAEMTETPIVLLEAQRGGPSTGLPTKPEQSDLEHVLYTSQGDGMRFVVAPGNIRECYEQTRLAFQVAYDYQLPGIVMTDQKISGEFRTVDKSFFERDTNLGDIGKTLTEDEIAEEDHHETGKFNRYQYLDDLDGDSVSPRTIPGQKDGRHLTTGNEHNKQGHISEDPENRQEQMDRRMQKLDDIQEDLIDVEYTLQTEFGDEEADVGVITFGSQQGTVREAVDRVNESSDSVKGLGVSQLKPFPVKDVQEFLDSVDECIVVEMNASEQFRNEMVKHVETRRRPHDISLHSLTRYDGNPVRPKQVEDKITQVINNE